MREERGFVKKRRGAREFVKKGLSTGGQNYILRYD